MGTTTYTSPPASSGRGLLWLGVFCAILGPLVYVGQISQSWLTTPWYAPALATLGTLLVVLALGRRRSVWRFLALGLVLLLTGFQWFFITSARLPAYAGPVAAGEPFPDFRAARDDGNSFAQSFTAADLKGDKDTVLVFFRGHW